MLNVDNACLDKEAVVRKIARAKGWVLDVDGCIVRTNTAGGAGGQPIAGAVELVRWIKESGKTLVVCTNASQQTVSQYATHLRSMGFDIDDHDMVTAATAAAAHIAALHQDGPVVALGHTGLIEALREAGVSLAHDDPRPPTAVVVGAADNYWSAQINAACLAIADHNAAFYVTVDAPWFHGGVAKSVSTSSSIAHAIEWVTGVSPITCGKPSPAIASVLSKRLAGPAGDTVVVGDVASIEVKMAREMGAYGVLVLSGATSAADLPSLPAEHQPHLCVRDVSALLSSLQTL
jgi:HAD superfamily hydrolase (TIGR01450 family)